MLSLFFKILKNTLNHCDVSVRPYLLLFYGKTLAQQALNFVNFYCCFTVKFNCNMMWILLVSVWFHCNKLRFNQWVRHFMSLCHQQFNKVIRYFTVFSLSHTTFRWSICINRFRAHLPRHIPIKSISLSFFSFSGCN